MTQQTQYDTLTGQHIILRKARESDAHSMLKHVWSDPDVYQCMLFQPTLTKEDALERCRRSILFQKEHLAWFVALKDTDEAVGVCAIRENEPGHYEECGICIGTAFQGKGYGKEIVSLLLELVFEKLGAVDCRYGYFQDNLKSKRVAEHFGFVYDRTEEMTRLWDGSPKTIDSCLLTRDRYLARKRFILSQSTRIIADDTQTVIRHGLDILRRDMKDVLTASGPDNSIRLVLDSSLPAETYRAEVSPDEILLRCGDDLGAMYALLSVSEKLGIEPLGWWMGLTPERKSTVEIPCRAWESPAYRVRYRCWFVNDEVLFSGWHSEENARAEVWERVLETVLRCGGNMVICGTDRGFDGSVLNEMALDRGLWLTQHHTELLGARMFARVYPDLQASYTLYPEKYEALWQESIDSWAGRRVVWTIGFRGQGDRAFWEDDGAMDTEQKRGAFISSVMRRQMEMVLARDPDARFCTNLYGEMMALYRNGCLSIPDEVIKLWGDNGFGKMVSRRQNNSNPRTDAMPGAGEPGENGIYYHVSFYDLQAANHITPLQNPPQMIADELKTVLHHGADTMWCVNVGSIYPHAFFLDLVSAVWKTGEYSTESAAEDFARRYYGNGIVSSLLTSYGESAVFYGPHEDDRAGDQYYHWPLRSLAHALLRGETEKSVESLIWAAGDVPFPEQVRHLAETVRPGILSWKRYLRQAAHVLYTLEDADARAADRLRDREYLYGLIHQTGCEGLWSFCQACMHALRGDDLQACLWTDRALECHRKALDAMNRVWGRFAHIYRNDCFAGVSLTVQVLEAVRSWLRIRGDGEYLFRWEKQYLVPREEALLSLQSHRTVQLSDDELCLRLRGEIPLLDALNE